MKKLLLICTVSLIALFLVISPKAKAIEGDLIIINKSTNQLAFFENGILVKQFRIATGKKPSYTPEGTFQIVNKIKNRPYYSGNIAGGDPNNPLGNRWLGINARGTNGDIYAIHGNNNPDSIGTYASNGCIRMHDAEIEWLYDRVSVNTTVHITSSSQSFESIAASIGYHTNSDSVNGEKSNFLKYGARGEAVREIQKQLTNLGYNTGGVDGIFGKQTEQAVLNFQIQHGLLADGIVGPQTSKVLAKQ